LPARQIEPTPQLHEESWVERMIRFADERLSPGDADERAA